MAKIDGTKVFVYANVNGVKTKIAGQKDASLSLDKETIDVTTKDSNGWNEYLHGVKSWSIDCSALLSPSQEMEDATFNYLVKCFMEDLEVEVSVEINSKVQCKGKTLLTSLPISFPMGDAVSYDVTLQGNGPLTIGEPTPEV